jgi:FkbM family methyltransferase
LEINRARLDHLESLGLPLEGRSVLDVGCGVGHLAQFFVGHNCRVVCVDGREENVGSLRRRYPGLKASVADVESGLKQFGAFDIVFCYGLLYHLENPVLGIRNMAEVCQDLLLLETLVCDSRAPVSQWTEEPPVSNQALKGLASRPSPGFVRMALTLAGFPFVYTAALPPKHPDFDVRWDDSQAWRQHGHLIRCIFVASRRELHNPNLIPMADWEAPPRFFERLDALEELPESRLLELARSLTSVRPLLPFPGWHFDSEWDNPDLSYLFRQRIWDICRRRGRDLPLEITWYDGLRVCLRLSNDLSKQLFIGGCYDPNEFFFLGRFLKSGMTVVDAGANEGLYTLFAAQSVGPQGKVWAFEPSSREFDRLRLNVENNGLTNTRLFPYALADSSGERELLIADPEHAGQSTLGRFSNEVVRTVRQEKVPVRRLDDLVSQEGLKRLDLIKLDVEGAEVRVLQGAGNVLRQLRPLILFEVLEQALIHQESSLNELLELLHDAHYSLWRFDPGTGIPVPAASLTSVENMLAVPLEMDPAVWSL